MKKTDDPPAEAKQPVSCFTMSRWFISTGDSVKFSSCSNDYTGLHWDFGDGKSSDEASPSHCFSHQGLHRVRLTATNGTLVSHADTSIYVGMQASVTFTFSYSDKTFPPSWPPTLVVSFFGWQYQHPDSTSPLKSWHYPYLAQSDTNKFICEAKIPDPSQSYFLKARLQIAGHVRGPDPDKDYYVLHNIGEIRTDTFAIGQAVSSQEKSVTGKYITFRYTSSGIVYK